ncbi:PHD finger protein ALFIN-LIKE 7-like [Olea europaea var. sylvestris]|uniref:PHD finger protein ALFIN-LIKE 7-like n=1 Tax=Olea europaea var. sylvestris TaxID=158386 RepID=UPI000C1CEE7C|nr:PHD finger protein ALFIN-LIKE 7-like [Olea europaea var. sylvestris]
MAGNVTVEDVFTIFKGRRAGLIKAFTTDAEKFYEQCNPGKEKLCLFGYPNETWEVKPPDETLPPAVPEPIIGINFARDKMQEKEWFSKVAILSDGWLLSLAFCYASAFKFGKSERNKLFQMINDLPTMAEVVTEAGKPAKDMTASASASASAAAPDNSKNRSRGKTSLQLKPPEKALNMFTSYQRRGED